MPWYVIYTKPKNEKKVARLLQQKEIEVYCPVRETVRQWSDRKKKIKEPLFRSYVFVFLDDYDNEKIPVLSTPGVVRFLSWLGQPGIVYNAEIMAIRSFLNEYKDADLVVDLVPGDYVNITEGPFTGHSGELISIRGNKVILALKSLRMQLSAEVLLNAISIAK